MEELRTAKKEMKSADEKRERKGHDNSGVTKERQLTSVNTEWLIDRYLVRWWYEDSYPREDAPRPDDLDEDLAKIPGYDFIYRNLKTGKIVLKRDSNPAPSRKVIQHPAMNFTEKSLLSFALLSRECAASISERSRTR
jgi:hypothetical protein